jgi:sugar O-acyltransferase (sialic acid O-acetyltransferase NeuD family)
MISHMVCNSFHQENPGFTKLYIFGSGGSGREVAWLAEQAWGRQVALEFIVDDPAYLTCDINGLPVRLLSDVEPDLSVRFVIAIGDPKMRRLKAGVCRKALLRETLIVHPRAELSRLLMIGEGTIVCAGVIATTNIRLGKHVHVNLDCTISHDVVIGDYSTLSPGVHVSGHVHIGESVFIGTGANIINGKIDEPLVIGDGAVIAAGSCVTKAVPAAAMVAGVPAVRKR